MLKSQTKTFYWLSNIPEVKDCPFVQKLSMYEDTEADELLEKINYELGSIIFALDKYDRPYEPEHKKMCDDLKAYKKYLEENREALEKIAKV